MKKKWMFAILGVVVVAGALFAARSKSKQDGKPGDDLPFRLGKVQTQDLQVSVREVGVVDPENKVDVKSTVSGRLVSLRVKEGDVLAKGAVMAEVEPDVTQAQSLSDVNSAVTEADLRLQNAERELRAQKALFDAELIGIETLRNFQSARDLASQSLDAAKARYHIVEQHGIPISATSTALQIARVTSPMDGVVITKGVELGETVTSGVSSFNAGTVLFTVADLKTLLIKVNLNEVDIAKVHVGQPVRITLDAYPQKTFTGRVRFVAPAAKLQEKIKVFPVEVALDDLDPSFRTGMSANVEILGEKRDKALSIPLEALQRKDGQVVAYRLKKDVPKDKLADAKEGLGGRNKFVWLSEHWQDYFDAVPVVAGIATLERVEIASGLVDADQVSLEDPTRKKVEKDDENN